MLTTVIGAMINIILDPIFIFVLDLGVRGAALATVLSQAVGAVWILRFLTGKKTILHLRKENFRLRRDIILPCLALGISTFVMLSTESILSISFTSSLSKVRWRPGSWSNDHHYQCQPACYNACAGDLPGGQLITSYNFGTNNKKRVKEAFLPSLKPASFYDPVLGCSASCMPAKTDPADPSDLYPAALFI